MSSVHFLLHGRTVVVCWWLFPRLRGFLRDCSTIQSPPTILFIFICLFEVEISSRTLNLLFMSGSVHNGSPSLNDCGRMFPDKLRVSSYCNGYVKHARTGAHARASVHRERERERRTDRQTDRQAERERENNNCAIIDQIYHSPKLVQVAYEVTLCCETWL